MPFTITPEDLEYPEVCPVLGLVLERGIGRPIDESPSIDRIVPSLGYIPGNVRIISNKANRLKSNATVADLELVLADLKRIEEALLV